MMPLAGVVALAVAGCATSPAPPQFAPRDGRELLEQAAKRQGTDWRKVRDVIVAYDGRWALFPRLTQPVLVDAGYRGSSEERYRPRLGRVDQVHRGPDGEKRVVRTRSGDAVSAMYDGRPAGDPEVLAAAALVADAYPMFLFGASWVLAEGSDFRHLGPADLDGAACELVEARLRPGIGRSAEDRVVVWIERETGLTRRVYFTLNGLESTRGAEVDVTMSGFVPGPGGSRWPSQFLEMIRRPVDTRAHEWHTTSLVVDGFRVK